MGLVAKACAAALMVCLLVPGGPSVAASGLDGSEQPSARIGFLQQDTDESAGPSGSEVAAPVTPGRLTPFRAHPIGDLEAIAGLGTPAFESDILPLARQVQRSSAVPLPTGLSMFGAALLALGLLGFVSGSPKVPILEAGHLMEPEHDRRATDVGPSPWFTIEFRNARGSQVRHSGSARDTIDSIADDLNEGWELVRIRDRNGQSIEYEDVVQAWRCERSPG